MKKRRNDETKSFKDAEICIKALELSFLEVKSFAEQNDNRLIFLTLINLFFQNYEKSLKMEEFVKQASYKLVSTISDKGDWFFEELVRNI